MLWLWELQRDCFGVVGEILVGIVIGRNKEVDLGIRASTEPGRVDVHVRL